MAAIMEAKFVEVDEHKRPIIDPNTGKPISRCRLPTSSARPPVRPPGRPVARPSARPPASFLACKDPSADFGEAHAESRRDVDQENALPQDGRA